MIYYYNERVSCMRCINGHRAAGCTHVERDLYTISGRGRPNTRYGKMRYRFLAGTVKFCGMTYVPIFKPGTDNTYTHSGGKPTRTVHCLHIDPMTPFQGVELINDGDDDTMIYPYIKFDTYFENNCSVSIWDHNKEERVYQMDDGTTASEHPLRCVKAIASCHKYPDSPIVYYRLRPPPSLPRPYHALPQDTPPELETILQKYRQKVQKSAEAEFAAGNLIDISNSEGFHKVEECGPIGLRVDPSQYIRVERKRKVPDPGFGVIDQSSEFYGSTNANAEEKSVSRKNSQSSKVVKQTPNKARHEPKLIKDLLNFGDQGYQQAVSINEHLNLLNNIQKHKMGVNPPQQNIGGPDLNLGNVNEDSNLFLENFTEEDWSRNSRMGRPSSHNLLTEQGFDDSFSDSGSTNGNSTPVHSQSFSTTNFSPVKRNSIGTLSPHRLAMYNQMLNSRESHHSSVAQLERGYRSAASAANDFVPYNSSTQADRTSSTLSNNHVSFGQPSGTFQAAAQGHVEFNESFMRSTPLETVPPTPRGLPHIEFVLDTIASSSEGYNQAIDYSSSVGDGHDQGFKSQPQSSAADFFQEQINQVIGDSTEFSQGAGSNGVVD